MLSHFIGGYSWFMFMIVIPTVFVVSFIAGLVKGWQENQQRR